MRDLYPDRPKPTHEQNVRLAKMALDGDIKARNRLIELNVGLAYNNALRYSSMNRARSHISDDDLLQSAMVGLCEAAVNYDPSTGYKFVTYAHWWVNKRLSEEVVRQHWSTVRPPKNEWRAYLYRKMDDDEQEDYVQTFMTSADSSTIQRGKAEDDIHIACEVMRAIDASGLTVVEEVVFRMIYDPSSPDISRHHIAKEIGISKTEVIAAEKSALEKIRDVLGIE